MSTDASTHPFISFEFTAEHIDPRTWLLLGETMSKCQHLAGSPLKPGAAEHMMAIYLARGVQATTAIEGNTLSEDEVMKIVESGSADVHESREYLQREVQNVLGVIREMDECLQAGRHLPVTAERLRQLNARVLEGIPDKPEVVPGEFRRHDVVAGPYKAPHWQEVPGLVEGLVRWLRKLREGEGTGDEHRFVVAVLSAVLTHLYIAWIHPFGNGNGRVARLVEVQILSESGVVPLVATNLLSDHYNKTRSAYYLALDEARKDVGAFIRYAVLGFAGELREQIALVRRESLNIHWESYVYELFRSKPSTEARDRQRLLALELPSDRSVTPRDTVVLTAELARRYAKCGDRTPARDLNELVKMGLAAHKGRRSYFARRDLIEAFVPPVSD